MAFPPNSSPAPAGSAFAPANGTMYLSPPPPPCRLSGEGCASTTVSDSQITFSLWVWACAGLAFLLLFGAVRKWIPSYHTRLNIPNVWLDPPPLRYGTFDRFWSWLEPVFRTTDAELVRTAGLDALMLTWQCTLGIQIFGPLTVLGMVFLLPVNLVGGNVARIGETAKASSVSTFSKLTLSNVQHNSKLFWIPFVFVFMAIFYIFWLLEKYYRAYVVLRQHYLTGGEKLINEWHQHYMEKRAAEIAEARKRSTAFFVLRNMFDINSQMQELEEDLEEVATENEGLLGTTSRQLYRMQTRRGSAPLTRMSLGAKRATPPKASTAKRLVPHTTGPSFSSPAFLEEAAVRINALHDNPRAASAKAHPARPSNPASTSVPGSEDFLESAPHPKLAHSPSPPSDSTAPTTVPVGAVVPRPLAPTTAPSGRGTGPDPNRSGTFYMEELGLGPGGGEVSLMAAPGSGESSPLMTAPGSGVASHPLSEEDSKGVTGGGLGRPSVEEDSHPFAQETGSRMSGEAVRGPPWEGSPGPSIAPNGLSGEAVRAPPPESSPAHPLGPNAVSGEAVIGPTPESSLTHPLGPNGLSEEAVRGSPVDGSAAAPTPPRRGVGAPSAGLGAEGPRSSGGEGVRDRGNGTRGTHFADLETRGALNSNGEGVPDRGRWTKAAHELENRNVEGAAEAAADVVRRGAEPRTSGWSKVRNRAQDVRNLAQLNAKARKSSPFCDKGTPRDLLVLPPVSAYETHVPLDADLGREEILKWWATGEKSRQVGGAGLLMGKPNVRDRKIVNTFDAHGQGVGVNAQQYVVLVQDVPDLFKERERARKRTQSNWTVDKVFLSILHFFETKVIHTKAPPPDLHNARSAEPPRTASSADVELGGIEDFPDKTASALGGEFVEVDLGNGPPKSNGKAASPMSAPIPSLPTPFKTAGKNAGAASEGQPNDSNGSNDDSESDYDESGMLIVRPQVLVEETFKRLFPNSFLYAVPVYKHKEIDKLLIKWDRACDALEGAEADYEACVARGWDHRPTLRLGCLGLGAEVDKINHWAAKVRALEKAIPAARSKILAGPRCDSYFVFFDSQKDAAIAAQVNIHPQDGNSFRIAEAPGPEEVNWSTLWMGYREREARELLVLPLIIAIVLLPIGVFAGTVTQLNQVICTGSNTGKFTWYCATNLSKFVVAVAPPILLSLWQQMVLPVLFYCFALMEGRWTSLSAVDRRIATLYFSWDVFNVFLGGMLGGSIFRLFNVFRSADLSIIWQAIGTSLPSASNFFINFVILQGFGMVPLRILYPQIGVLSDLLRLIGIGRPKSEHDKMDVIWPHSIRYGKEVGGSSLIFIVALSYSAASPIILPVALVYFITSWVFWRYTVLYVWERCYESGGRMFDTIFSQITSCLFILEFFTGCIFIANGAFVQASLMWFFATLLIWNFTKHCKKKYGEAVKNMPLETAALAPNATVPPEMYMPPALRRGCPGWYPEYGKAWEYWGAPAYVL